MVGQKCSQEAEPPGSFAPPRASAPFGARNPYSWLIVARRCSIAPMICCLSREGPSWRALLEAGSVMPACVSACELGSTAVPCDAP
jgi:hypothetical protein